MRLTEGGPRRTGAFCEYIPHPNVAHAATSLILIWCMIYLQSFDAGQNVTEFTLMDRKYSEKCYMAVKTVSFVINEDVTIENLILLSLELGNNRDGQ